MYTAQNINQSIDQQYLEQQVKDMYTKVAQHPKADYHFEMGRPLLERLGYPAALLDRIPAAAMDSFAGVGHYFHLANIEPGEQVVDFGSGSGTDAFVAALYAGSKGSVIGIDMTDAQLNKATQLKTEAGFDQVSFVKGYIDHTPLADNSADVVISNGVINLALSKPAVFAEAARLLRPGGRLAIADIVTDIDLPEGITCNADLWAACIGGAISQRRYHEAIEAAGLEVTAWEYNVEYRFLSGGAQSATEQYGVKSVSIQAVKPFG